MTILTFDDLNNRYEAFTSSVRCECVFATEMVGGQPANEEGVRQYVIHHLKIEDPAEQEQAVRRILHEEVEDTAPEDGELPEGKMYGLRAVRKSNGWPYVGDWMIKAALKMATSRLSIFSEIRGTKGSFAEAGRVRGWKYSLQDPAHQNLIYLCNEAGDGPAETYFKEFMGRVSSPSGPVSIIHQSECVAPGSRFAFEFRFMPVNGLNGDAIRDALSMMMIVGLGSARSLECGKFRIERAEIDMADGYKAKPLVEKKAKAKAEAVAV